MVVRMMTSSGEASAVLDGHFPERKSTTTEKPKQSAEATPGIHKVMVMRSYCGDTKRQL